MPYQFPDDETLVRYLALLGAAILEAKMAGRDAESTKAFELLDAVQDVPDLLTRWPDMREDWVLADLETYERKHLAGEARFSGIIKHGAPPSWRQPWQYPEADEWDDPMRLLKSLVDRWCGRRELGPLSRLVPAMLANGGLTDGWAGLRDAIRSTVVAGGDLPENELAELRQAERLIDKALRHR